jgi:hypothetical protein
MKIKDIVTESSPETQMRKSKIDFLLKRIEDTDDPTELKRLNAKLETYLAAIDQEGGVAQDMDQADVGIGSDIPQATLDPVVVTASPPPGTAVAKPNTPPPGTEKERGAGYELTRAQAERDEYLQRQAKELARMKANAGMKDSDYKTSPGSKRTAQDMAPDKANADMKDSDYKTSPGSKRTAQDLALDKEYTYKAPDGRRLKYKHGDIRNAFHSSPDSRKAGSDKVIRGDRVGKRLVDKEPVRRTNQDDRAK